MSHDGYWPGFGVQVISGETMRSGHYTATVTMRYWKG
jgi:hypothetical protein